MVSSCQPGLRPKDALQSSKWSLRKPARLHSAGEEAAVQSWEQLIEHPGGAVALIRCDVCSLRPSVRGGGCTLSRLYELQSHWIEHRYSEATLIKGVCCFRSRFLISGELNSNQTGSDKRHDGLRCRETEQKVINGGLTRCSSLCLAAPITVQRLNPVYCFSNCHAVYGRGFHRTRFLIPPPPVLPGKRMHSIVSLSRWKWPYFDLDGKRAGSPPLHLAAGEAHLGYNKSSVMFTTRKSSLQAGSEKKKTVCGCV